MKKIFKQITGQGIIRKIDKENFTITAVVSDESIDRYNEVIRQSGWDLKAFKKHPVIVACHDYYNPLMQIGEAVKTQVVNKELLMDIKYYVGEGNLIADWAWQIASKKRASYSVGFYPKKSERVEKDEDSKEAQPDRIYLKQELLETSHVVVPANKNALQKDLHSEDMIIRSIAEAMKECILEDDVPESFRKTPDYEDMKECLAKGCQECDGSCNDEPDHDDLDKAIDDYIAKVNTEEGELTFSIDDLKFLHACKEAKDMTLDEINIAIKDMIGNIVTETVEQVKEKLLEMMDGVLESSDKLKEAKSNSQRNNGI
jgi:hypothetical protein